MKPRKHVSGYVPAPEKEWIVIGDASRFVVLERKKGVPFDTIETFTNPAARVKVSDLLEDQPGRSFDRFTHSHGGHQTGVPRHTYSSATDPKEHALDTLVRRVTTFLNKECSKRSYTRLTLIAEPRLLGRLRTGLSEGAKGVLWAEHPKDMAKAAGDDLVRQVQELMHAY